VSGGGGGVGEKVSGAVIKMVGAGDESVESHGVSDMPIEQEKQIQQSAMAETSVKKFGESQIDIVDEPPSIKQEYAQALSGIKSELEDRLSGLIIDDSTTRTQVKEIVSLFDKEIINASAGSKVDSSLLTTVKENTGSNIANLYDRVMHHLSDTLSLEQEFLFKGVPKTYLKMEGFSVSADTDAPTHLLKYHLDDGWHAVYDSRFLYSITENDFQIFDAKTGQEFVGNWTPPFKG